MDKRSMTRKLKKGIILQSSKNTFVFSKIHKSKNKFKIQYQTQFKPHNIIIANQIINSTQQLNQQPLNNPLNQKPTYSIPTQQPQPQSIIPPHPTMSTQPHHPQQPHHQQQQQWIVVTKNRNKHKGSTKHKQIHNRGSQNLMTPDNREEILQKFQSSKAFQFNQKLIEGVLDNIQATSNLGMFHVECLGLGNFLANKKCQVQLQFMELIILPHVRSILSRKQKSPPTQMSQKSQRPMFPPQHLTINVYDPAFTPPQLTHLTQSLYTSLPQFKIHPHKINIFFMPHCQRFLYQAVYLQYNQTIKQKSETPLIIIGNSIQQYKERCVLVKEKIPDVFLKVNVKEERVFDYQNALNDTFVLLDG